MQYLKNIIISLVILLSLITFAQSETSWIKKKDKTKDLKNEFAKEIVKEKTTSWIKKKEVKDNKKKVKDKIKESKSWITKKSKEKVKDIKEKLKKHKSFDKLPKGEFYFAAYIEPLENEEIKYVYGYVNSDRKSDTFKVKNKSFYSKSDGVAYFDDKSNRCEIDSFIGVLFGDIKGKVVLKCKKGLDITGDFKQVGTTGKGEGETSNGNSVKFKFYNSKIDAIAQLENYKIKNETKTRIVERALPSQKKEKVYLKPNGKYYALLIGNSIYDNGWSNLVSPTNDITEIEKSLNKNYNFEKIIVKKDANKKEIFKAFQNLSKLTTSNDYVFVYYSGHGITRADQAYWVPTDGSKEWGYGDWINTNEITIFLREEVKAHHLALLVDSCYVGSAFKGTFNVENLTEEDAQLIGKQFQEAITLRERIVVASGANNRVEDSVGKTGHSRFAASLLKSLEFAIKYDVPLNIRTIKSHMDRAYSGILTQKPQMYSPATWGPADGEFIFIPKKLYR